jgi:Pyridoxal-phosphate dependent enzyme
MQGRVQSEAGCAKTLWRFEEAGYLRAILTARVYDVAVETPLERAAQLSARCGSSIYFKREDLQPVFSFKLRGAFNKMASLSAEQLEAGVICSSAGNHAQGVAMAAQVLGTTAVICMPVNTPEIKARPGSYQPPTFPARGACTPPGCSCQGMLMLMLLILRCPAASCHQRVWPISSMTSICMRHWNATR